MFSSSTQATQCPPLPLDDSDSGRLRRFGPFGQDGAVRPVGDGSGESQSGSGAVGGWGWRRRTGRAGEEGPWRLGVARPPGWGSQQSQSVVDAEIAGSQHTQGIFITPSETNDPGVLRNVMAPPSPPKKRFRLEPEFNPSVHPSACASQGGTQGRPATCPVNLPFERPKIPVTLPNIFDPGFDRKMEAELKSALKKLLHHQWRAYTSFVRSGAVGQGDFSTVYKVKLRVAGGFSALKESRRNQDLGRKLAWAKEVQAMRLVQPHPNVVAFYDGWSEMDDDEEVLYIWMELCGASLTISGEESPEVCQWKEADLISLLKQMASALECCHSKGIAHLDIKPDNIYHACDDNGVYKLGDFGIASRLDGRLFAEEGDSRYLAQEVLQGNLDHLEKADIFSLGATLYELASGRRLVKGGKLYEDLRSGKLKLFPNLSIKFQEILKQLLAPNPEDRPSASSILKSPLVARTPLCLSRSNASL
eukprot:evm.model.scf_2190.2 EVM.evm.TU.scf_2190.2   scf_2190:5511-13142(-)